MRAKRYMQARLSGRREFDHAAFGGTDSELECVLYVQVDVIAGRHRCVEHGAARNLDLGEIAERSVLCNEWGSRKLLAAWVSG